MKRIFFLSFIMLLPLMAGVYTQKSIKIYRGEGYGVSREEAINNALIEAIGQIHGVKMSKITQSKDSLIETDDKSSLTSKFNSKIDKITQGRVNSYEIEEVEQLDDHKFRAVIIVKKVKISHKYKAPGHNPRNRRSLAVLPFEYKNSYTIYSMSINGKELSNRITQSIINKITQTRKFTILDRQNSKYYQFEKSFLKSGDTDPVELARLGKRLGADYFIIGQILDFAVNNETSSNYYTGQTNSKNSAFVTVAYRILNIPTQQIKWSDTIDIEFEVPNAKRTESLLVKIGDKVAQVLVDQIIFNIYPPKIIKISGKNAIVNMGGNVLHMGDRFKVFALGNKLYDPYTKEYLGREEIEIGEVEITAVKPKVSYAKVISGKIKKGAILRKTQIEEKEDSSDTPDGKKESMFEMMFQK